MKTERLQPRPDGLGAQCSALTTAEWQSLGRKVDFKVRFRVGYFCSDVDDLVQETLARFQRALNANTLRNPGSLDAFLSGICNNVIFEYRRDLWREVPYDVESHPEPSEPPNAQLFELRDSIEAALGQLGARDRQILTAFYLQELDKTEICRAMGVTDAQFRTIIFRAKDRLRRLLSG